MRPWTSSQSPRCWSARRGRRLRLRRPLRGNQAATAELLEIVRLLNDWWVEEGQHLDSIFTTGGVSTGCRAVLAGEDVFPSIAQVACGAHPPSFVAYFDRHTEVPLSHFRFRVFDQGLVTHTFLIAEWEDTANDRTVQINHDTWLNGPQATTHPVILTQTQDVTEQLLGQR